jgi:Transglycosylase SLT domain
LKLYQYMRKFVRQHNTEMNVVRCGLLGMLALTVLAGLVGLNMPQAHAQEYLPQSSNSSQNVRIIYQVFGPYGNQAMRVAQCESGLNPNATNGFSIGGSHAAGLFQILYPSTWYTTSQAGLSPYDAAANTRAAHDIFVRDGYSWREWSCQP